MCNSLSMKNPPFLYHRPTTIEGAVALLDELGDEAKVMAGGQSLLPVMAIRLANPENIVDISRVEGLNTITISPDGKHVRLGALVTHSDTEHSDLVSNKVPLLAKTMPHIGHRAIRNRGTVCGSLAHGDPAAELPSVAVALGATINLAGPGGNRAVVASDFFTGFLSTEVGDDELVTSVDFPIAGGASAFALHELSRRHGDFALLGLASSLTLDSSGVITSAALVFLGVSSTPWRATTAEALLIGGRPSAELFETAAKAASEQIDPATDAHASAAYRTHVAGVLTKKALSDCGIQLKATS